jgi:hypothetical protein
MFKRIKSQTVSDEAYDKGVVYTYGAMARHQYWMYLNAVYFYNSNCYNFEGHDAVKPDSFADWLEAQGVRIV